MRLATTALRFAAEAIHSFIWTGIELPTYLKLILIGLFNAKTLLKRRSLRFVNADSDAPFSGLFVESTNDDSR